MKEFQILHCEAPSSTSKSSGQTSTGTARTQTANGGTKTQAEQQQPQQSKSVSPVRRSRSISPVKEGTAKQPKKPDPTIPLVPAAKGKPSEAPKDANPVRVRKTVRAATADGTEPTGKTAPEERKPIETSQERDEKERNSKAKSTTPKRKNVTAEVPEDLGNTKDKSTVRAAAGSAVKEGDKNAGSPSASKPSVKSTANGGESKNGKTSSSAVALKLTNNATVATKKKQGKENSVIREEIPNRGS